MVAIGVVVGLMQIVQHFQYGGALQPNLFLLAEVVFYVVVLPLLGSLILGYLERSESARRQALDATSQQYAMVRRLSSAAGWGELLDGLVEFPHYILPVVSTALYMKDAKRDGFTLVAFWSQGESGKDDFSYSLTADLCPDCLKELHHNLHRINTLQDGSSLFSLPLTLESHTVGLLHLRLPAQAEVNPTQVENLEGVATEMALVLDRALLRDSALDQARANAADRKQIAQDLHDTLAQNIAYLRLKLEELLMEDDPRRQIALIRKELSRMRDTADEAYVQVRETLASLHHGETKELAQIIEERATAVASRAGFEFSVTQQGEEDSLEPTLKRQITYICREALTNIEKHSRAKEVVVSLTWLPTCLDISIRDNGTGFDPQMVVNSDHYGMAIMRERAEQIGSVLEVSSEVGKGTTVHLSVPLRKSAPDTGSEAKA